MPTSKTARQLPPAEIEELARNYAAGSTVYELAREYGIHRETVARHLQHSGVKTRYRLLGKMQVREAGELYVCGWTLKQIGERYSVDPETVRQALLRAGVQMRVSRGRPRRRGST